MDLSLTDGAEGLSAAASRAFARERVAPQAAAIDESGAFPRELVTRGGGARTDGRHDREGVGGAGRDYVSYALAIEEMARASADGRRDCRGQQLARRRAARRVRLGRRRSRRGCGGSRPATRSARSRCRRSTPGSDAANQQTVARLDDRGYVLNGRKVWVANAEAADLAIVFAATQPGHARARRQRVPRADGQRPA